MTDAATERVALKDRVLEAALLHAAFDGWSRRTLTHAAQDAGVDLATARRLFPQAGDSLLAWLDDWADRRMLAAIDPAQLEKLSLRRRIAHLVRTRLEILVPHREALRRAVVARLMPTNALQAGSHLWRTVDRMWQAAGVVAGREEGISYWSRRSLLAGVLLSTLLFWLEDQSDDCTASWAFLDRRIEDVMRLGRLTERVRSIFGGLPGMGRRASA